MDRAAIMKEEAGIYLRFERESCMHWKAARESTRECLAEVAAELGFSPLEISAAVDRALKDAGTTP